MKHLSPEQIVDVADGGADAALVAHARDCDACRSKVGSVLDAVRLTAADSPPEPSPLFWPHLAARIGEAVRREPARVPFWGFSGWRLAPIGAVAVLAVAVVVGSRLWPWGPGRDAPAPDAAAAVSARPPFEAMADAEPVDDASWRLVSDLSAEVSVDEAEASGALPPPGGADSALLQLDDSERMELARILREEIAIRTTAAAHSPGA